MDMRRIVGENTRRLRVKAGLSQRAVADRMGVDRAYVSSLEQGKRNPTVITLWHIAQAIDAEPAELLFAPKSPSADAP